MSEKTIARLEKQNEKLEDLAEKHETEIEELKQEKEDLEVTLKQGEEAYNNSYNKLEDELKEVKKSKGLEEFELCSKHARVACKQGVCNK